MNGSLMLELYEWLVPVKNALKEMTAQKDSVRTEPLLIGESQKESHMISWYTR